MLMPDGKIRQRFVQHFEKFLNVSLKCTVFNFQMRAIKTSKTFFNQLLGVDAVKRGSCANDDSFIPPSGGPRGEGGDGLGIKDTIFHGIIPSAGKNTIIFKQLGFRIRSFFFFTFRLPSHIHNSCCHHNVHAFVSNFVSVFASQEKESWKT